MFDADENIIHPVSQFLDLEAATDGDDASHRSEPIAPPTQEDADFVDNTIIDHEMPQYGHDKKLISAERRIKIIALYKQLLQNSVSSVTGQ
jgi:hypothetical protein